MKTGDRVELHPLTKKGKERVKQHGGIGVVRGISKYVLFSQREGPWLLTDAAGGRWVHQNYDTDFDVCLVESEK